MRQNQKTQAVWRCRTDIIPGSKNESRSSSSKGTIRVVRKAKNNIEVHRAVHPPITKFEKGTHIKEDVALLQGWEIENAKPGRIVHTGKILFEEEGPGKFALHSFKSAAVTVAEAGLDYTAGFNNVSNKLVEKW